MIHATMTAPHDCAPEEYQAMLDKVRAIAARNWPGMEIRGLKLIGGVWYAVTDAGEVSVRDISKPTGADARNGSRLSDPQQMFQRVAGRAGKMVTA